MCSYVCALISCLCCAIICIFMIQICVNAVLAVADMERKDVNFDMIKVCIQKSLLKTTACMQQHAYPCTALHTKHYEYSLHACSCMQGNHTAATSTPLLCSDSTACTCTHTLSYSGPRNSLLLTTISLWFPLVIHSNTTFHLYFVVFY
jgi:hypothetical protein